MREIKSFSVAELVLILGFSKKELACILGCNVSTVRRWVRNPNVVPSKRYAQQLHWLSSIIWLFGAAYAPEMEPSSDEFVVEIGKWLDTKVETDGFDGVTPRQQLLFRTVQFVFNYILFVCLARVQAFVDEIREASVEGGDLGE